MNLLEDQPAWPRVYREPVHALKARPSSPSTWNELCWQQANQTFADWKDAKELGMKNEIAYWKTQLSVSREEQQVLENALEYTAGKSARDAYKMLGWVDELKKKAQTSETENTTLKEENESLRETIKAFQLSQSTLKTNFEKIKTQVDSCEEERDRAQRSNRKLRAEIKALHDNWASLAMDIIKLKPEPCTVGDRVGEMEQELSEQRRDNDMQMLRHRKELRYERALKASLEERITALEFHNAKLTESLAACWLHSFWAWIAQLLREIRRSSYVLTKIYKFE